MVVRSIALTFMSEEFGDIVGGLTQSYAVKNTSILSPAFTTGSSNVAVSLIFQHDAMIDRKRIAFVGVVEQLDNFLACERLDLSSFSRCEESFEPEHFEVVEVFLNGFRFFA